MDYQTPLRDMRFLINDVLDFDGHYEAIESDASRELVDTILEQCARFAENELFPLRASGDKTGCSWNDGVVTTPAGFAEAYAMYVQGGWPSIAGNPAFGGQDCHGPSVSGLKRSWPARTWHGRCTVVCHGRLSMPSIRTVPMT